MDYETRARNARGMLYRTAPDQLRIKLINGGKPLTPLEEQEAAAEMRSTTQGPVSLAQMKRKLMRSRGRL